MIDVIKKFFGPKEGADASSQQGEGTHDIQLAACALLLEMATIDGEFTDIEKEHIVDILKREYDFSAETAAGLMASAEKELDIMLANAESGWITYLIRQPVTDLASVFHLPRSRSGSRQDFRSSGHDETLDEFR